MRWKYGIYSTESTRSIIRVSAAQPSHSLAPSHADARPLIPARRASGVLLGSADDVMEPNPRNRPISAPSRYPCPCPVGITRPHRSPSLTNQDRALRQSRFVPACGSYASRFQNVDPMILRTNKGNGASRGVGSRTIWTLTLMLIFGARQVGPNSRDSYGSCHSDIFRVLSRQVYTPTSRIEAISRSPSAMRT